MGKLAHALMLAAMLASSVPCVYAFALSAGATALPSASTRYSVAGVQRDACSSLQGSERKMDAED